MKYAYWLAECKTSDCHSNHIAKFIGEADPKQSYRLPPEAPASVYFVCPSCGKSHRYILLSDLRVVLLPFLPRVAAQEWW